MEWGGGVRSGRRLGRGRGSRSGYHKELRLVLFRTSLKFLISPRTTSKLGLVITLCEINHRGRFHKDLRLILTANQS